MQLCDRLEFGADAAQSREIGPCTDYRDGSDFLSLRVAAAPKQGRRGRAGSGRRKKAGSIATPIVINRWTNHNRQNQVLNMRPRVQEILFKNGASLGGGHVLSQCVNQFSWPITPDLLWRSAMVAAIRGKAMDHRIAAIFAADIGGYGRPAEADGTGAIERNFHLGVEQISLCDLAAARGERIARSVEAGEGRSDRAISADQ